MIVAFALASTVNLDLDNVDGSGASGNVKIASADNRDGSHKVRIDAKLKGLTIDENKIYEGWLVDLDSDYKLSLGAFNPLRNGRFTFRFSQDLVNSRIYDKFVITREMVDDIDPGPDVSVLEAEIPGSLRTLIATLEGAQEVPPVATNASGEGMFVLDPVMNTLSFDIMVSGLESEEIGAHIHGMAMAGSEAGVLLALPLGEPKVGVWHYDEDQENDIRAGLTYVNVHTELNPDGEIRGQLYLA